MLGRSLSKFPELQYGPLRYGPCQSIPILLKQLPTHISKLQRIASPKREEAASSRISSTLHPLSLAAQHRASDHHPAADPRTTLWTTMPSPDNAKGDGRIKRLVWVAMRFPYLVGLPRLPLSHARVLPCFFFLDCFLKTVVLCHESVASLLQRTKSPRCLGLTSMRALPRRRLLDCRCAMSLLPPPRLDPTCIPTRWAFDRMLHRGPRPRSFWRRALGFRIQVFTLVELK